MSESLATPTALVAETADALKHFYDHVCLRRHAILASLRELLGDDPAVAVQRLRSLLLDTIEEARTATVSTDHPARRPYEIVHSRYILGKELAEVEAEFALGERQIQREQQKAFAELAARLWARLRAAEAGGALAAGDVLAQEIARVAGERELFDAGAQLERALASVSAMAQGLDVTLQVEPITVRGSILGDPALYRQLLISLLSLLIRLQPGILAVRLDREGPRAVLSLEVQAALAELPPPLLALAQANGAEVSLHPTPAGCRLRLSLPTEGGEQTIVIVEDNEDLSTLFARYLARRGYRVIEIPDPTTALERIAQAQPDAIVLDVMMSALDGWEVLQRLRSEPRLRTVPVAICSVLDEAELASWLGADAYLKKPVGPAQLMECLARLLSRPRSAGATPSSRDPQSASTRSP